MKIGYLFRRAAAATLCIGLLFIPLMTDNYTQYMINLCLIYVIIGIGLNILLGYAGQFAFAHAALMGIGAYTTAILTTRLGLSFWLALPLSGVVAAAVGALGALPAMRMKRVYLALVTLAFAQLVVWVFLNWTPVTMGTDGIELKPPSFFGYRLRGDRNLFYVVLFCTIMMYWLAARILQSRIGRSFVTIRENEIVARCNGINVAWTKTVVFALSAFYAGIGGSLYALSLGFIVPEPFGLAQLTLHFSIVVLGGLLSLFGAVIGAVLLTALPEFLRDFQALQEIIYGLILIVVVLAVPEGIAGVLKRWGILPREVLARNWRSLQERRRVMRPPVADPVTDAP